MFLFWTGHKSAEPNTLTVPGRTLTYQERGGGQDREGRGNPMEGRHRGHRVATYAVNAIQRNRLWVMTVKSMTDWTFSRPRTVSDRRPCCLN